MVHWATVREKLGVWLFNAALIALFGATPILTGAIWFFSGDWRTALFFGGLIAAGAEAIVLAFVYADAFRQELPTEPTDWMIVHLFFVALSSITAFTTVMVRDGWLCGITAMAVVAGAGVITGLLCRRKLRRKIERIQQAQNQ